MVTAVLSYDKLDIQHRGSRVGVLQPGKPDDPFSCCTLHTVSLNDKPHYEALSYVWGDPSLTDRFNVDGRGIMITKNLYTALWYCREDIFSRAIWADALCINQVDTDERST